MARRLTRSELATRARQDWLCERTEAELEPCTDCGATPGTTCFDPRTGRELTRLPAHASRIRARARSVAART